MKCRHRFYNPTPDILYLFCPCPASRFVAVTFVSIVLVTMFMHPLITLKSIRANE